MRYLADRLLEVWEAEVHAETGAGRPDAVSRPDGGRFLEMVSGRVTATPSPGAVAVGSEEALRTYALRLVVQRCLAGWTRTRRRLRWPSCRCGC